MRKIPVIGLAFVTILVFNSIVSQASALVWLVEGVEVPLGEAQGIDVGGTLLLEDSTTFGKIAINCTIFFEGRVERSLLEFSKANIGIAEEMGNNLIGKPLLCKPLSVCENGMEAEVWTDNMPWKAELESMEPGPAEFLDHIFAGGTGEEAGYEVVCLVLGISVSDLCEGLTSVALVNKAPKVVALFNPAAPVGSQNGTCTATGEKSGVIEGEESIETDDSAKETLSVG